MAFRGVPPRSASGVLLLSRAERQSAERFRKCIRRDGQVIPGGEKAESIALETIRAVLSGLNTGLQLVMPYER